MTSESLITRATAGDPPGVVVRLPAVLAAAVDCRAAQAGITRQQFLERVLAFVVADTPGCGSHKNGAARTKPAGCGWDDPEPDWDYDTEPDDRRAEPAAAAPAGTAEPSVRWSDNWWTHDDDDGDDDGPDDFEPDDTDDTDTGDIINTDNAETADTADTADIDTDDAAQPLNWWPGFEPDDTPNPSDKQTGRKTPSTGTDNSE